MIFRMPKNVRIIKYFLLDFKIFSIPRTSGLTPLVFGLQDLTPSDFELGEYQSTKGGGGGGVRSW
jgi:hypothetical protein